MVPRPTTPGSVCIDNNTYGIRLHNYTHIDCNLAVDVRIDNYDVITANTMYQTVAVTILYNVVTVVTSIAPSASPRRRRRRTGATDATPAQ